MERDNIWDKHREVILAKRAVNENYTSPLRAERIKAAAKARWADPDWRSSQTRVCKPTTLNGVTYPSIKAASEALGVCVGTIKRRLAAVNTPSND
jgi:hypothetical protein